jgi:hypothetical protein
MPAAADYGLPENVRCPFCEGRRTELHSPFGTALSVATYWCLHCRTAFEWLKWGEPGPGARPEDEPGDTAPPGA